MTQHGYDLAANVIAALLRRAPQSGAAFA